MDDLKQNKKAGGRRNDFGPLAGPGEPDLRGWEWRYLWQECRSDAWLTLRGSTDEVYGLALSPDGAALASASRIAPVQKPLRFLSRCWAVACPQRKL